ncbi:MAG: ArnT family glycosyltransferase, partial [bacterium]
MEFTTYTQNKIVGLLLVVLVAGAAFFPHIGSGSLWDRDETSYALVAKEMLARGNWSVPYRNGKLFIDKPAFTFWFIASAYKLFGISEFSARFFSAVFGVGAAELVYWLGVVMFGPSSGLYGTLIFISSLMVTVICRSAVTDSYLLFFCTASLLAFRYAQQTGRWNFIYLFYLLMGLAVLVKG